MNLENELRRVAKQYQDEGYTVTLRPHGDAVPAFVREFDLDGLFGTDPPVLC
jgi:hypothetical protein